MISRKTRFVLNSSVFITAWLVFVYSMLIVLFYNIISWFLPDSAYFISGNYLNPIDVKPEPDERYTFYFFIIIFLPLTFIAAKFFPKLTGGWIKLLLFRINPYLIFSCVSGGIFFIIFFTPNFISQYTVKNSFSLNGLFIAISICVALSVVFFKIVRKEISARVYELLFFFILIFASSRYIVTQAGISAHLDIMFFNFQFVLDPIINLVNDAGADFSVALYGNYAFFLAPVIRMFPDRILATSSLLVLLLIVCHLCLYFVVLKVTSQKLFAVVSSLAILFTAGNYSVITTEPYFQYYPIRVIFPAIIILLFLYSQAIENKKHRYLLISFFCGFALIWNFDTGICITITFFFIRVMQEIENSATEQGKSKLQKCLKRIANMVVCEFSTTILVLLLFFFIVIGVDNFAGLFRLQQDFYLQGFYMLPIPCLPNLWMLVMAIYIAGGIYFFRHFGNQTKDKYMIFFLSIFGIGIFSYFQGRSYYTVLPTCIYPAIMLFFIFLNKFFQRIQDGKSIELSFRLVSECIFMFLILIAFISFKGSQLMHEKYWRKQPDKLIADKVEFINNTSPGMKKVVILSDDSTYLYCLTGKQTYPFVRRTLALMKKTEVKAMIDALDQNNIEPIYVDIHTSSVNFKFIFEKFNKLFAKKYIAIASDKSKKMFLLRLKSQRKRTPKDANDQL